MKKKGFGKGRCKNGHPIDRKKLVVLGHTVGVCLHCGHKYIISAMPATYTYDERNDLGERFHVYTFACLLICGKCQGFITSIQISCKTHKEEEEIWRQELANELITIAEEKKKDEK